MTDACAHLSADALLDYWLCESGPAETDAAEEHLMRCDTCGEALDELIALGEGVRSAFRAGDVWVARRGRRILKFEARFSSDIPLGLRIVLLSMP